MRKKKDNTVSEGGKGLKDAVETHQTEHFCGGGGVDDVNFKSTA